MRFRYPICGAFFHHVPIHDVDSTTTLGNFAAHRARYFSNLYEEGCQEETRTVRTFFEALKGKKMGAIKFYSQSCQRSLKTSPL